ncbi:MAG: sugar phosphate isomerase/epimerase [Planctomycetes bacterium]|nr:sugar phosphate isomerase/epimerase [Planctomycetota bacterium]
MSGGRNLKQYLLNSVFLLFAVLLLSSCNEGVQVKRDVETPPLWGICRSVSNADKMKAAGYSYVEESVKRFLIPQEPDEKFGSKQKAAEKASLQVYSYNGFLPGSLKSTGPKTDHEEILKYAETAFVRAEKLGSKIIVFGSGGSRKLPKDFSYEKGTEQFTALLKKMGPIAAKYGITVVIEPLNSKECNFINSVKEGTDIARAVKHPNIAVLADIYHMAKEDEGPESIRYAGKLLKHCHIAEREGRKMPGTNNYDFTPYFKALKDINYQGRMSLEGRWDNFDKQLVPVIAYLNDQWAKAK